MVGTAGENQQTLHSAASNGRCDLIQTRLSQDVGIDALDVVTADTALTDHLVNEHSIAIAPSYCSYCML
jgi:hypothetical protein